MMFLLPSLRCSFLYNLLSLLYLLLVPLISSLLPFLLPIPVLVQPFVHRFCVVLSVLLVSPPPSQHAIVFVFSSRTPDGPSACSSVLPLLFLLCPPQRSEGSSTSFCSFRSVCAHHGEHVLSFWGACPHCPQVLAYKQALVHSLPCGSSDHALSFFYSHPRLSFLHSHPCPSFPCG